MVAMDNTKPCNLCIHVALVLHGHAVACKRGDTATEWFGKVAEALERGQCVDYEATPGEGGEVSEHPPQGGSFS